MREKSDKPILVIGIPRSGTTWLAKVLASAGRHAYVHEPDNERHTYSSYFYKQNLSRFPFLLATDTSENYYHLFYKAFNQPYIGHSSLSNKLLFKLAGFDKDVVEATLAENGINTPNLFRNVMWLYRWLPKDVRKFPRIIKSVHCLLALEYLLKHFDISPVVIIRHPAAAISSSLHMKSPDIDRKIYENRRLMNYLFEDKIPDISGLNSIESFAGFQVAIFYHYFSKILKKNNDIILIEYERLCTNPLEEFQSIFDKLNIDFSSSVIEFINNHNTQGTGYDIKRPLEHAVNAWESKLSKTQIEEIKKGYNVIAPVYYTDFIWAYGEKNKHIDC